MRVPGAGGMTRRQSSRVSPAHRHQLTMAFRPPREGPLQGATSCHTKANMKGDHVGEFEELLLLAIRHLQDTAYGVSIQRLLERETSRKISIGAVYASLDRLEAKGLVRSAMAAGEPI